MAEASTQRFNHVAVSVPCDAIDTDSAAEIFAFYREVFGWSEMPGLSRPRELLVMRAHSNEQFVFVSGDDESPTRGAEMDHFGLSVATPEELDGIHARARAYAEKDERVRLLDRKTEDFQVLQLHSFYVGYQLPLLIEVQCYEWAEGTGPSSLPDGAD